jgi:hypothetical protein
MNPVPDPLEAVLESRGAPHQSGADLAQEKPRRLPGPQRLRSVAGPFRSPVQAHAQLAGRPWRKRPHEARSAVDSSD